MKLYAFPFKAMGTPCDIQLFAEGFNKAKQVATMIIADIERLEALYSRYRQDSYLTEINRIAAIGGSISVDVETAGLLNYATTCFEQSSGLFDITSGILRQAWHFDRSEVPDQKQISALLNKVGWDKVKWQSPVLEFPLPGMEIDFGGIVKEYTVDRAATISRQAGLDHGLVNLGGDIKIIGPRYDGQAWQVGIRHPRSHQGLIKTISITEGAVASSGDYERCITVNNKRYGHVLNPTTGWPVRHLAAVSVVGDLCVVSGSASTIAMLKEEQGPAWLNALGLPHFWIDVNGITGGTLDCYRTG